MPLFAQGQPDFCQVKGGCTKGRQPDQGRQSKAQFDSLSEQIDEATRAKDTKKVEALAEGANELEEQLRPEYHALFDALNDADSNSKDVQDKYQ